MSIPSPETEAKVARWRQMARDGTLSINEMREAIIYLRSGRAAAPVKTAASKAAKAGAAPVDTNALLGQLGIKF